MKKISLKLTALLLALLTALFPLSASAAYVTYGLQELTAQDALCTFELISDPHLGFEGAEQTVTEGLTKMKQEGGFDAVVIGGDLTNTGDMDLTAHFFELLQNNRPVKDVITAPGNHDMGQMNPSDERRAKYIACRNADMGIDTKTAYYSYEVKGYKFIVLADEGNGINTCHISNDQISWLDEELADGAANGKPVFVICHWPMKWTHGSWFLWPILPGGSVSIATTNKLQTVMKKYNNVFFLSGHLHEGLNNRTFKVMFRACCVEDWGGITCVNSPSFSKTNRFGIKDKASGFEIKIYSDKVVLAGKNYLTGEYYNPSVYTYTVPLTLPAKPATAQTAA